MATNLIDHSNPQKRSPGFRTPFNYFNPDNVVLVRAPTVLDTGTPSTFWVQPVDTAGTAVDSAWFLSRTDATGGIWIQFALQGSAATFTTLTSTGQFNLDTTAVGVNTLGNLNGATSLAILVGTGGFSVDGVGASDFAIGASATTGDIDIGGSQTTGHIFIGNGAAMTGQITLGNSTGIQTIVIGAGSGGAKTIQIGSGTAGNQIQIGQGVNTVAQTIGIATGASGANSDVNILTGNGTAGTQTLNVLTGTRAGAANIGTGAAAHVVTIGSVTGAAQTSIRAGTGGLALLSAGQTSMDFLTDIVASPTATAVINARQAYATYTGFTTAAAGTQVFTITNSIVTAGSSVIVTVNNLGANDAQMTMTRVLPGAGTIAITCQNLGPAALNGDVNITLLVLD